MRQIISISIVFIILLESLVPRGIGFSQDFDVGEILKHYKEHQIESKGDLSFLAFLTLHYSSDSDHRDKNPDSLPCLDGHSISAFLYVNPVFQESFTHTVVLAPCETRPSRYAISYNFDFSQNLLQPPRA